MKIYCRCLNSVVVLLLGLLLSSPVLADLSYDQSRVKPFIWLPFAFYTPETKTAGGLLLRWNRKAHIMGRIDQINLFSVYTQNGQSFSSLSQRRFLNEGWDELSWRLGYFDYPDRYYGRGDTGYFSKAEIFNENRLTGQISFSKHLGDNWFLRSSLSLDDRDFRSEVQNLGLQSEFQNQPSQFNNTCFSLSLDHDTRDYAESPKSGVFSRFNVSECQIGDRVEFDGRYYQNFTNGILATQVFVGQVFGSPSPFAILIPVGGPNVLRGNFFGRYRDFAAQFIQSEWRKPINDHWTWVTFAGLGEVQDRIISANRTQSATSIGGGLHYFLDPVARTKLRIELGISHERSIGFYFVNGEAF